jgi:ankyrin repeat protein
VHVAAVRGSLQSLQLLVARDSRDKKEVLADYDAFGMTPLVLASLRNRVECVAWMLASSGLVGFFVVNPSHCAAVHMAAAAGVVIGKLSGFIELYECELGYTGNIETLKLLVSYRKQSASYRDGKGCTPVYFAAQEGHLDCLVYLVNEGGANPLAKAKDEMTSLHAAAQGGHTSILKWLVGVVGPEELLSQTSDGATPVHYCAAKGHPDTLKYILKMAGQMAAMKADVHGCTPAHDAADGGHTGCLALLIEAGASLFQDDIDGMSPYTLALAAQAEHPQCAEYVQAVWAQSWEDNCKELPLTANGDIPGFITSDYWSGKTSIESPLPPEPNRNQSENSTGKFSHVYADVKIRSALDYLVPQEAVVVSGSDSVSMTSGVSTEVELYDVHTHPTINQVVESCPNSRGPSRRSSANLQQIVGFNYSPLDLNSVPKEYQPTQSSARENNTINEQALEDIYAKIIPKYQRVNKDSTTVQISPQIKQDEGVQASVHDQPVKKPSNPGKLPKKSWPTASPAIPEPPPCPPCSQPLGGLNPGATSTQGIVNEISQLSLLNQNSSGSNSKQSVVHEISNGNCNQSGRHVNEPPIKIAKETCHSQRQAFILDEGEMMSELQQVFLRRQLKIRAEGIDELSTDL